MKKLFKTLGVLIFILALLGWWGYDNFFRSDPVVQQQLVEEFGPQFFNFESLDTPAVNTNVKPAAGSFTAAIQKKAEQQLAVSFNPAPVNGSSQLISAEAIIQKYAPEFQALEQVSNSSLETIYSAAVSEYVQHANAGTLDHAAWTRKYLQACLILQANIDTRFNSTLSALETELKANQQSTQIISEIKKEYSAAKRKKVTELVDRAHGKKSK